MTDKEWEEMKEKVLEGWKEFKEPVDRLSWDEYFILEAYKVSTRSLDPQTQCGCVFVRDKTPISTGYNSFIGNINDSVLPNLRPEKYQFMMHSEANAIYNCSKNGVSSNGAIAYVTGKPCNNCFQAMHQAGIKEIRYYDGNRAVMTNTIECDIVFEILTNLSSMIVTVIPATSEFSEKIDRIKSCR